MRRLLAWVPILTVVLSLLVSAPVAGSDLAAGNCSLSLSSTAQGGGDFTADNACDGDDASQFVVNASSGATCGVVIDLGASPGAVSSYRVVTYDITKNDTPRLWYRTTAPSPASCTGSTGWTPYNDPGDNDLTLGANSASTCGGEVCEVYTGTLASPITARYWSVTVHSSATAVVRIYAVELDDDAPVSVPITDYIYNLNYTHPPFARQVTWDWRKVFNGSWTITNAADEVLFSGTRSINDLVGDHQFPLVIQCPILCGADTYTLSIIDTTNNQTAGFAWSSDASGTLISAIPAPDVLWAVACYNATLNQCASPLNGAAGKVVIQYAWTGGGTGAIAAFCPVGPGGPPCATLFSTSPQAEGTHAVTFTITVGGLWALTVTDEIGRYDRIVFNIDYTTPGTVTTYTPPPAVAEDCEQSDNLCFLRNLPGLTARAMFDLLRALFQPGCYLDGFTTICTDATQSEAFASMRLALLAHEPTASIVAASDRIGLVLTEMATTSNAAYCSSFSVGPVPIPVPGGTRTETWSIPLCLETIGGTTEYQTFRTIMGGIVYLQFAFALRAWFQPKPVVVG